MIIGEMHDDVGVERTSFPNDSVGCVNPPIIGATGSIHGNRRNSQNAAIGLGGNMVSNASDRVKPVGVLGGSPLLFRSVHQFPHVTPASVDASIMISLKFGLFEKSSQMT